MTSTCPPESKRARRPQLSEEEKQRRQSEAEAAAAIKKHQREWGKDSENGRFLLALRAGPMCSDQLTARFGSLAYAVRTRLAKLGLVDVVDDGYTRLTDAGRAACPKRAG